MLATAIHAWLQSAQNYAEGLALLHKLGTCDETDLWFLELGETQVSRAQLARLLEEAHARNIRATLTRPETSGQRLARDTDLEAQEPTRDVISDGYAKLTATMPAQLRDLHDQVTEWAREMNYLRYPDRMEKLPTDADRLRDALRIVELDERIASAYSRLDAWRDTGTDPGEHAPAPASKNAAKLAQELKNIESYLSRSRPGGKRPASPEQRMRWEKRKADIKALIDALPD